MAGLAAASPSMSEAGGGVNDRCDKIRCASWDGSAARSARRSRPPPRAPSVPWGHLQEIVLVGAVGLGGTIHHFDRRPRLPAPALSPQDAGFILRNPVGATFGNEPLRCHDIDHTAADLRVVIGGDGANIDAL